MEAREYVYNKVLYYCHTNIFLRIDINIRIRTNSSLNRSCHDISKCYSSVYFTVAIFPDITERRPEYVGS